MGGKKKLLHSTLLLGYIVNQREKVPGTQREEEK